MTGMIWLLNAHCAMEHIYADTRHGCLHESNDRVWNYLHDYMTPSSLQKQEVSFRHIRKGGFIFENNLKGHEHENVINSDPGPNMPVEGPYYTRRKVYRHWTRCYTRAHQYCTKRFSMILRLYPFSEDWSIWLSHEKWKLHNLQKHGLECTQNVLL